MLRTGSLPLFRYWMLPCTSMETKLLDGSTQSRSASSSSSTPPARSIRGRHWAVAFGPSVDVYRNEIPWPSLGPPAMTGP